MKLTLALSGLVLLLTGCAQPQYVYYQPQPAVYYRPAYVTPPPYYMVQPRCYWTQQYSPRYNSYRSVRVCY